MAAAIDEAAGPLADRFASVEGAAWQRTGNRSDGATFTVDTFARYFVHDPVHHLDDVAKGFAVARRRRRGDVRWVTWRSTPRSSPVATPGHAGRRGPRRRGRAALLHGHPVARLGHLGPERRLRRVACAPSCGPGDGPGPAGEHRGPHPRGRRLRPRRPGRHRAAHLTLRLLGPGQHDAGRPPDPRGARVGPRSWWRRARSRRRPGAAGAAARRAPHPGRADRRHPRGPAPGRPALLPQPRHPPARLADRLAALGSARPDRPLVEPLRSDGAVRRPLGGRLPPPHPDRHDGLARRLAGPRLPGAAGHGGRDSRPVRGVPPARGRRVAAGRGDRAPGRPAGWWRPPARCGTGRAPWSPRAARR